jgi:hypothetical protein
MPKTFTLKEYPNPLYINDIANHPAIWKTQVKSLEDYCDSYDEKVGYISIEYVKTNEYGRYYLKDPKIMSCTVMWNKIRATLFADSDYDLDIACCHQNVMVTLLKTNTNYDYNITHLEYYCANRDKVIESISIDDSVINDYNNYNQDNKTKKDIVKSLFTIILYGGTIDTWREEYGIGATNYSLTQFVKDYIDEIQMNTNIVIGDKRFKTIVESVKSLKIKEAKEKYKKKFNLEKFKLGNGAVLSVILQEYETLIIEKAMEFVKTQNCFVTSYNYDGFQIRKVPNVDKVVSSLNNYISSITIGKFVFENIKFIVKPFKEGLDVKVVVLDSVGLNYQIKEMSKTTNYKLQKAYFERFHAKIENPFCYIRDDENGIMFIKPKDLDSIYKNVTTKALNKEDAKTQAAKFWGFTSGWLSDENMRTYYTFNYYPDNSMCPANCYNLWKPFPILKTALDPDADTSKIYAFINTLLGDCNEYVLNWLAHIVQTPWRKTEVCILLYGAQGCGKSTIGEYLLRKIIGETKMIITSKADKMFGKFVNTQGKLLAILNECSGKDTFNICDILKDAISMTTTEQEKKGVDAVTVTDYTNFIFTTNNINSVKIEEGDRRFMPIEINSSLKNNVTYFKELYADLNNDYIMRKFYEELMKRPLENFNPSRDRPMTELRLDMLAMNKNGIKDFIEYWKMQVANNANEKCDYYMKKKMSASELYEGFNHFWNVEGRKVENKPTFKKWSIELKQFRDAVIFSDKGNQYSTYELIMV